VLEPEVVFVRLAILGRSKANLDVMHIEKNICDNLLGTFMNVQGKTKDTLNSRLDLEDMGIRVDLHLQPVGDDGESFEMP
jgi:hypothetical protein